MHPCGLAAAIQPRPPPSGKAAQLDLRNEVTLSICLRCRDGREIRDSDLDQRGGRRLAKAVVAAFDNSRGAQLGVRLRGVNCMSQCKRPCAIALSGPSRFTYLFGDLDPERHAQDVLDVSAAYAQAEIGFLKRPSRPEVMQGGILGRIPPLGHRGDLVEELNNSASTSPPKQEKDIL